MQEGSARVSLAEGRQALRQRDFAGAARAFGQGAAIEPENPVHLHGAAVAARRLGDYGMAENCYRAAMAAAEKLPGDAGSRVTAMAMSLADIYRGQGRYRDAEKLCFRILGTGRAGQSKVAQSRIHVCLAELYRRQGRFAAAERSFRTAIAQRRATFGAGHPKTIQIIPRLADVCRVQGRDSEADDLSQQAASLFETLHEAKVLGHA